MGQPNEASRNRSFAGLSQEPGPHRFLEFGRAAGHRYPEGGISGGGDCPASPARRSLRRGSEVVVGHDLRAILARARHSCRSGPAAFQNRWLNGALQRLRKQLGNIELKLRQDVP